MKKVAIILHAEPGTHDSLGRALHALLYCQELNEHGHEVKLIFDGGGTRWVEEMAKPEHKLNPLYRSLKDRDVITGVCDFCIDAFEGDKSKVKTEGLNLVADYNGHPSLAALIDEDHQVITL